MANKKKTTKKSTSAKKTTKADAKKSTAKKTSVKKEKELKEKEIEKELDEEELDEAYEDEYELDEDEFEDDFEDEEEEFEDDFEDKEEFDEEEDEFEEEEEFEEDEDDFEEKPSRKDSTEATGSKKVLWIVLGCVLAFLVLSFVLPSTTVKDTNETKTTENTNPSVSKWLEDSKKEKVVTIVASSTCPHCKEYRPVIERLAKENNFNLYFFEVDLLDENDQYTLLGSYELSDYEGAVPYTFIVDAGKVNGTTVGFATEDETVEFLKKYKVMK